MSDVHNLGLFLKLIFQIHNNRQGQTAVCLVMLHMYLFMAQHPQWARASSLPRLHDHRHTAFGRTFLDE